MATARVLHFARVPVLIGLLLAVAQVQEPYMAAWSRLEIGESRSLWLLMLVLAAAFVAVSLADRQRPHSWSVLALEGVIAAIVGLIPPVQWIMWFDISTVTELVAATTPTVIVPVLAIAWLVTVVMTFVRQVRSADSRVTVGPA